MKKHLSFCIQIEETVGKIYRNIALSPRLTKAVRETLQELAADEDEHANQLRFALRFPEDTVVSSLPEMLEKVQCLLQESERILEKTGQIEIDDQQAISIGVELEKKFSEIHIANSFNFKENSLKEMFAAMAIDEEQHCKRLLDLQKSLCHS